MLAAGWLLRASTLAGFSGISSATHARGRMRADVAPTDVLPDRYALIQIALGGAAVAAVAAMVWVASRAARRGPVRGARAVAIGSAAGAVLLIALVFGVPRPEGGHGRYYDHNPHPPPTVDIPAPSVGEPAPRDVHIVSFPSGARVTENGTEVCSATPCDLPWRIDDRTLTLTRKGFKTMTITVGASNEQVRAMLQAIPVGGPAQPADPKPPAPYKPSF